MDTQSSSGASDLDMLRETLRKFVAREMPREKARDWDRNDVFPSDVFARLVDLGVAGLTVPEEFGGSGVDIVATMAVIEELSKRSLAVAVPYIMCSCYCGMNIRESGTEDQKRLFLPKVAAGEILFAYGLTEPDVGADLASVSTSARIDGDQVIVSGAKRFCTGANIADYIYTLVRSDPDAPRYKNLSLVLVPTKAPGVSIQVTDSIGMKGAPTTDTYLDNVAVPVGNIVGGLDGWNNGWKMLAGSVLNVEKLEVAAMALGIAEAAVADAWAYAQERVQFGKPVSGFQAVRHRLADMRTDLLACRLMLYHAADLASRGLPCGVESSMAKLFVTERGRDIVIHAQEVVGAYGLTRDLDMERYVRDMLILPIAGGSSNIQRNNIAQMLALAK
ncbi:MAG: acyl-CoA/acyl-ACP dehydrogenase [Betaproteobacteria bacterium]|nr:acyl-CoA/acyl-ACP dehydrogenase [Betaproteobacteria bacterium]